MTGHDLRQVADSLLALPYKTWDFGDSVAFEGLVAASQTLGDRRYLEFAHGWVRCWATRAEPYRRLDCTAPGAAMVVIAEQTEDARVLDAATRLADYLLGRPTLPSGLFATWEHAPLQHPYGPVGLDLHGAALLADPPPGAFIDCLHFDPPFLTQLGRVTAEPRFTDAGATQALAYVARLQGDDGLFDHFELLGEARTFGRGWGRGQGWALLGLLDVLDAIGPEHPARSTLMPAVDRLIVTMLGLQLDSGHWSTDIRDSATGIEPSTAAFMAVGFRRARRQRLGVDGATLDAAADRAHDAVMASLSAAGTLPVSAAVMASTTDSHYAHVPTGFVAPWGQGPLALMLAEAADR